MSAPKPLVKHAAGTIVREVKHKLRGNSKPCVIAIDGPSGSGKSTLAAAVAEKLGAVLVSGDDFFAAHMTNEASAQRDAKVRAAECIEWQRLRCEVLEPLLAGKKARWRPFDFQSGSRSDGTYRMLDAFVELAPARVIVVDGAYSTRPELPDLVDLSVLVDVPVALRHERLSRREESAWLEAWRARWDEAKEYYFTHVRPVSSFDLVIAIEPSRE